MTAQRTNVNTSSVYFLYEMGQSLVSVYFIYQTEQSWVSIFFLYQMKQSYSYTRWGSHIYIRDGEVIGQCLLHVREGAVYINNYPPVSHVGVDSMIRCPPPGFFLEVGFVCFTNEEEIKCQTKLHVI